MNDVIGIVNDTEEAKQLRELIGGRSLASIPFGGRYRMVDFTLSNMVNSGIENVGILVKNNYRSLMAHIRSPKEWNLDRKKDGLFILPPDYPGEIFCGINGELEILHSNLNYIERSKQQDVIISGVKMICNIDYSQALDFHKKMENDITIIYKEVNEGIENFYPCTTITTNSSGRIVDMEVNPKKLSSKKVSMEMYILSKRLLSKITEDCVSRGKYDFVKDGIINNIKKLQIDAYPFGGYVANINSVENYYKCSMELLKPDIWRELFFENGYIFTKAGDQPPAKYMKNSKVSNSLTANGCGIDGVVENCILFRKVKIHKGAIVTNCIVMQNSEIGENVVLENVIVDKDCCITEGKKLRGSIDYPLIIEKKKVI